MIPSREECLRMLNKYKLSKIKLDHILLVEKVAVYIAQALAERGEKIDSTLVSRGALLHDIGVSEANLRNSKNKNESEYIPHSEIGFEICKREGLDDNICYIVKNHILEAIEDGFNNFEEKIVFYADKICENEIIGLDRRFEPWIKNFPRASLLENKKRTLALQNEILNKLAITYEELVDGVE